MIKKRCCIGNCKRDHMIDLGVPFISETESGKFIEPYTNTNSYVCIPIPLCAFHISFAEVGLMGVTTNNKLMFLGQLTLEQFESATDKEIREAIFKDKNDRTKTIGVLALKTLVKARSFERRFDKDIKEAERRLAEEAQQ